MAVDSFRFPFKRSNNYAGAYNVRVGKAALPVMESMEFEADTVATGAVFVGTTSIVFSQLGNLSAPSVIGGQASIAFGQSSAMQAASNLGGGTTVTFGQSGDLDGPASFAGPSTLTFDQQGTFSAATVTAGTDFAGTVSITFGQSATFIAASEISGTSNIAFGQGGAFAASSSLGGDSAVTVGQGGSLSAGSTLVGTTSVTFGQLGIFSADAGVVAGGKTFGRSIRPTKIYRPFDRDVEAIQAILEAKIEKPREATAQPIKHKAKREIIRAITAQAVKTIEGDGLLASAPIKQEIASAVYEFAMPIFEAKPIDQDAVSRMIEAMLQRAAEAAYQQQVYEYEAMLAFEADEDEAICLLLAS